jgi:NADH:ubiquinone oxidoreductase subunit 5 (subunit L)/multisubunit Na+/H+ antiporter MnhA subunit
VDPLSATLMTLTAALCGLIARFSSTYLVREPGHARFYLLLSLFACGMFLLVMSGSLDLMIAGWELLGLSSMLLIGFFHERPFPVRNALRAFTIYRSCDIGLLTGTVLMHHYAHTSEFLRAFGADSWPAGGDTHFGPGASLIALCMLWAASGKSALFPLGSWLPRAMEGPTPSSAIFYGSLSVHAGAYLLLRMSPLLAHAPVASAAVVCLGAITAVHGSLTERVQSDVKSQLAYATITQVGVIFVEIGLGLSRLALFHLVAHALLRTLQLLRAPNVIHDVQMLRSAAGRYRLETGTQYRAIATSGFGRWLYHLALERFHLDAFWERFVSGFVLAGARFVARKEEGLVQWLAGEHAAPGQSTPSPPPPSVASQSRSRAP